MLGSSTIGIAGFVVLPLISAIIIVVIIGVLIYRYKSQKNLSAPIVGGGSVDTKNEYLGFISSQINIDHLQQEKT